MVRSGSVIITATLLAAFGLGLGFGCGDDSESSGRKPMDPSAANYDALPEQDAQDPNVQPVNCPPSTPKEGETCPSVVEANISCRYVVRQCSSPNGTYDVTESLCCSRGGIWVPCGINNPCEGHEVDASTTAEP